MSPATVIDEVLTADPIGVDLNHQAVTGFDRVVAVLGFREVIAVPRRHKWPTRVVVKLVQSKGIGTKPLVDLGRGRGIRTTPIRANLGASRTVLGNVSRIRQTTARKENNRQQGVASTHPIRRLDLPKMTKCYTIPSMIGWRMTMKFVKALRPSAHRLATAVRLRIEFEPGIRRSGLKSSGRSWPPGVSAVP